MIICVLECARGLLMVGAHRLGALLRIRERRLHGRKHGECDLLQLMRPRLCFQHETFEVGSAGKEEKAKQPDVGE